MAKHFYAFQFDMPYRPTYLRNWEVPKYYCPKPRRRLGSTGIIANSRGQLLPGVPRPPCNPFGDFIGTWSMPNRITRDLANKMNGSADKPAFMERCRQIASAPPRKPTVYVKDPLRKSQKRESEDKEDDKKKIAPEPEIEEEAERIICPIHDF